ncbi:MAG TPA: SRPBCC family protein [Polyangiaceae bacterium]|nr:SRPBCC family protein [Polyangiaceae bacterium]
MSPETSVRKSVVINAPLAHAFTVFTERFDSWWPRTHHIGKVEPFMAVLEPRDGGRWFERGADGSECEWGRVLVYSPPTRVVLSWHLDGTFEYDADPSKASRVEVTFHDEGNGRTRVELVHSQLDRHGAGWEKIRESVGSTGGWGGILESYATTVTAA